MAAFACGFETDTIHHMRLIDSHCHIQFNAYKEDGKEVIRRSLDAGTQMIVVGSQNSTSERAVKLAEKFEGLWAVVGLHPIHLTSQEVDEDEIHFQSREEVFNDDFYTQLAAHPKVVGIGETGFDFFHLPKNLTLAEVKEKQKQTFTAHCQLADKLNLPLVIHCRGAHPVLLASLNDSIAAGGLKARGVAHCFGGSWEEARRYLELGFYLGFTGIITFKPRENQKAAFETLWEVVKKTPLEKILVETDAPYLAPEPHRGRRNEPAFVIEVAKKIAELKAVSLEEVGARTTQNATLLFKLDRH